MATLSTGWGRGGRRRGAGRPPGSRNKATLAREAGAKTLTELAQEKTEGAVAVLEAVMNQPYSPASARVSAAIALLDRAWGRPAQRVEADEDPGPDPDDNVPVRLVRPGDDDFEELAQ